MYILVHHQINLPEEFLGIVKSDTKFPEGFKVHAFLPAASHKTATCIWEAPNVNALENLIEPILKNSSINIYEQVDEGIAVGLPRVEEEVM